MSELRTRASFQSWIDEKLSEIDKIENSSKKIKALLNLASELPPSSFTVLTQALEAAQSIQNESSRVNALIAIAPQLSESEREAVLTQALETALTIQNESFQVNALIAIAPNLLAQTLEAAQTIQDESSRVNALIAITPQLNESEREAVLTQALEAAQTIQDESSRASVLSKLAPQLSESERGAVLDQAIKVAQMIQNATFRVSVLSKIAPQLSESEREAVLTQALEAAQTIQDDTFRNIALMAIVPQLNESMPEQLTQAIKAAQTMQTSTFRASVLSEIASQLSESTLEQLTQAIEAAQTIQDDTFRNIALMAIVPQLNESMPEQLTQAIKAAQTIQTGTFRASVLSEIVPQLSESTLEQLTQTLEAAQTIQDESSRANALLAIAPQLSESKREAVLNQALEAAQTIQDKSSRANVLIKFASQLRESEYEAVLNQALESAQMIQDESSRANALMEIASQLSESKREAVLNQVLEAAQTIQEKSSQASVLSKLAPQLGKSERGVVLTRAIKATQAIQDESSRVSALSELAPQLSTSTPQQLFQALEVALTIQDQPFQGSALSKLNSRLNEFAPENLHQTLKAAQLIQNHCLRAHILIGLAPQLSDLGSEALLIKALKEAQVIQDGSIRANVLMELASRLNKVERETILKQALEAVQSIQNESTRVKAFMKLAHQLSDSEREAMLTQALEEAQTVQNESTRAEALRVIAPHLRKATPQQLFQALEVALTIQNKSLHASVLSTFAPQLNESGRVALLTQAIEVIKTIPNEHGRSEALSAIAPQISASTPQQLTQALEVAQAIKQNAARSKSLIAIAPQLSASTPQQLTQALEIAQTIQKETRQVEALSAIASQLSASTPQQLTQALEIAQTIQKGTRQVEALSAIASQLSASTPQQLTQALEVAVAIQSESLRGRALISIAPQLSVSTPQQLTQALKVAVAIQNESLRDKVLSEIAPQLPDAENLVLQFSRDRLSDILNLVKVQKTDQQKVQLLSIAAPRLAVGLLPTALQLIAQKIIKNEQLRVEALSNLAPYLPAKQLTEALDLCKTTSDSPVHNTSNRITFASEINRAETLCNLLPYFTTLKQYETVCATIKNSICSPFHRANALAALATELSTERVIENVLNTPKKINVNKEDIPFTSQERFSALVRDIWHMIESVSGDQWMNRRADILCQLIPSMSISQIDSQVLRVKNKEVLNLKSLFRYQDKDTKHLCAEDSGYVSQVLSVIAVRRKVNHPIHKDKDADSAANTKILNSKNLISDFLGQVRVLSKLPNISLAVELAQTIDSQFRQVEAWVEIACYSSQGQHQYQALQAISGLPNTYLRAQYLQCLIPYLHSSQSLEAGRVIQEIKQDYYRTQSLVALACKFPQFRSKAKTAALALIDDIQRVEQLSLLAVEMPEILPEIIDILEKLTPQGQEWLQTIRRKQLLVALTPHLPIRINREVNRRGSTGCSEDLWNRALYLLARGYRDALQGGSLRNESAQDQDLLNLQDEVNALADLLLMRDLEPPMAVGVLGGWGGGKSYIMHLMQQHMTQVRSRTIDKVEAWNPNPNHEKLSPYVGHIYQIKFDAWTFAKSDLWASLMQTIFFELNCQISLEQQLSRVLAKEPNDENSRRTALCEAGQYWAALYKTSENDRQWFLDRVLNSDQLTHLENIRNQGQFEDELWQQLGDTYRDEHKKLKTLQDELADTTKALTERKKELTVSVEEEIVNRVLESSFIAPVAAILSSRVSKKVFDELKITIRETIVEQIAKDEKAQQAIATADIEQLKAIVQAIAIRVIESRAGQLSFSSFWTWFKKNLRLFGLLIFFLLFALLLPIAVEQLWGWVLPSVDSLFAKVVAFLAPLAPGIATAQALLRGAQKWFDETSLAVKEYETQLRSIPEKIEANKAESIQTKIEQDPAVLQLEKAIERLQQKITDQSQRIPRNVYASLEEFVSDRLQSDSYSKHLGVMHQVKSDLADLSQRLLPPPAASREFQAKLDQLQKIFPRGPARVIVYIDDLDRCPPKRVVEVLEAVQLLVKTPLFIAVLAIDERYITRALEKYYDGVLSRRGRPSGTDYLEKIIQLPYRVRPIMPDTLDTYLRSQIVIQDGGTGGAKFSEFSRQEYNMLLECCKQVDLSPRTLKRLTNVYKLFKVVCRTRGTKPSTKVQKAILALLALSGRYPDLMRGIFNDIETCYEEKRSKQEAETLQKTLHLESSLRDFFSEYKLLDSDQYLQREFEKLQHDALYTPILPDITLTTMEHSIFNLIRSFSFVGEIGEDPEDYRFSSPVINGQVNDDEKSTTAEDTQSDS